MKSVLKYYSFFLLFLAAVSVLCGCNTADEGRGRPGSAEIYPDSGLKAGDTIFFGSYEQDNDPGDGTEPVEWQILAIENGRALVISRYALDAKPYNETYIYLTWRNSSIRKWLNDRFYNGAFSAAEKNCIAEVKNGNPANPSTGSRGGLPTKDHIFLLSIDEAGKYFADDASRQCEATPFAAANGVYSDENGNVWWWLRSPGGTSRYAANILFSGYLSTPGHTVTDPLNAVRPAFWLDLRTGCPAVPD